MHQDIHLKTRGLALSTLILEVQLPEEVRTIFINKLTMQSIKFKTLNLHLQSETRFKCIKSQRIQIKKELVQIWIPRNHKINIQCINQTTFQWHLSNHEENHKWVSITWWTSKLTHYRQWTTREWTWQWVFKSTIWTTCKIWL